MQYCIRAITEVDLEHNSSSKEDVIILPRVQEEGSIHKGGDSSLKRPGVEEEASAKVLRQVFFFKELQVPWLCEEHGVTGEPKQEKSFWVRSI